MRPTHFQLTAGVFAVLAVAATGCNPAGSMPTAVESGGSTVASGAVTTTAYACQSGREITVSYPDSGSIRLAYLGQDHAMAQVPAGAGARYAGSDMVWASSVRNGRDDAILSRAGADGAPDGILLERCARPVEGVAPATVPRPPVPVNDSLTAAPCKGPQLQLADAGGDAGMGNRIAIVAVRNLGSAACSVTGYPSVKLVDDRSQVLATVRSEPGTGSYFRSGEAPEAVVLAPGGRAWFDVAWNVVLHEADGETVCPTAARIRMTVPGDTSPVWLDHALTPCGGRIRVSPFRAVAEPAPAQP